jgi:hypothetical protein
LSVCRYSVVTSLGVRVDVKDRQAV